MITNVKYFSYRKARPAKPLCTIPRKYVKELEKELCEKCKINSSNNVFFIFTWISPGLETFVFYNNDFPLYPREISVSFSGKNAYFGEGIEVINR